MTMHLRYLTPADLQAMPGLTNGKLPKQPTAVQELQVEIPHNTEFDQNGPQSTPIMLPTLTTSSYQLKNKDGTTTTFQVSGVNHRTIPQLNSSNTQLNFPLYSTDISKVATLSDPTFDAAMRDEGFYGVQRVQIYIVDADKDGDQDMLVTHSGLLGAYLVSNDPAPVYSNSNIREVNPFE